MNHYPKYSDIMGNGAGPSGNPRPNNQPPPTIAPITAREEALNILRDRYRLAIDNGHIPRIPREERDPRLRGLSQTSVATSGTRSGFSSSPSSVVSSDTSSDASNASDVEFRELMDAYRRGVYHLRGISDDVRNQRRNP